MKDISESEVLEAMQQAMDVGATEDGITPIEAFEMLREAGHRVGLNKVRRLFGKLVLTNQAKIVIVQRRRWDGVLQRVRGIVLTNGK